MKRFIKLFISIIIPTVAISQETFNVNGTHNKNNNFVVFKNATIYTDYQTRIDNATLLIQDGIIISVDENEKIAIPPNAVTYDLKGKYIYPSFIDIYSSYGMPEKPKKKEPSKGPQFSSNKQGAFNWNQAIKPEIDAVELYNTDEKQAAVLRSIGFGTVLTHQNDGIMRGTSALVTLNNEVENKTVVADNVANHLSFDKGSSTQDYPGSLMGCIALIRQNYLDVKWYTSNNKEYNISLHELSKNSSLPQIFEVKDKLDILRADILGDEFNIQYIFKGKGDEYQRIEDIKATQGKLIVPINFPKAYDVSDPYSEMNISLRKLKHWELAPFNLRILNENNIDFALTTSDLKKKKDFLTNLRKAVKKGLLEQEALKALTYNPAIFINQYDKIGSLSKGKLANFIIVSDNIFKDNTEIYENWVKGNRYIVNDYNKIDVRGKYTLNVNGKMFDLNVKGEKEKLKSEVVQIIDNDTMIYKATIKVFEQGVSVSFTTKDKLYRLAGNINHNGIIWEGNAKVDDSDWQDWSAIRKENFEDKKVNKEIKDSVEIPPILYPNMAYGWDSLPQKQNILIQKVTVWTNEDEGVLKNSDVLLIDGKITTIGENLTAPEGTIVINGKGKHLTPGIIDEHSHIAISRGVNECTQAVTAEVSIADVVNSDDINIYRQLSGGVTTAQLLHGSCNPIGGQSALIKLKWGESPEKMKIKNTDGYIKFALGENVKRSNFGDAYNKRFPQTRMGVEQVYYDAFTRAKEYKEKLTAYNKLNQKKKAEAKPPRRDIELDALVEILDKKRFISCHSYVQSEINMLMHVGDSMGFTVNTFTHILEGYKLADKMKKHGAGGSTFSDWWAYKYEVNDAIPYNGAIMHKQGIVTAFNSDDAEMGRRLNQEAAKAVKYGGIEEQEALKFVTLNPAKLLHLDNRIGSIKVGKDADVVLWSGHPLSIYSKAEKTIIEGAIYYDIELDLNKRKELTKEKTRIIKLMLDAKKKGAMTQPIKQEKQRLYHCDTVGE